MHLSHTIRDHVACLVSNVIDCFSCFPQHTQRLQWPTWVSLVEPLPKRHPGRVCNRWHPWPVDQREAIATSRNRPSFVAYVLWGLLQLLIPKCLYNQIVVVHPKQFGNLCGYLPQSTCESFCELFFLGAVLDRSLDIAVFQPYNLPNHPDLRW